MITVKYYCLMGQSDPTDRSLFLSLCLLVCEVFLFLVFFSFRDSGFPCAISCSHEQMVHYKQKYPFAPVEYGNEKKKRTRCKLKTSERFGIRDEREEKTNNKKNQKK